MLTPRIAPLLRTLAAFALVAGVSALPSRANAGPVEMSAEQYKLFHDYKDALEDSRVKKMSDAKKMSAIARNFHTSEKKLKEAVSLGESIGDGIEKKCEKELRTELAASPLKGRVGEVKVDATDAHVVTYVEWRNDDGTKLEEEAATAAMLASRSAPITSTVAVWAKDAAGRKVFEAKINADAASRFSQDHIAMFAKARYIRVFEDVKNLYNGTAPTD